MYQYIKFIPQLDLVADTLRSVNKLINHFKGQEEAYRAFHHEIFIKGIGVQEKIITLSKN